MLPSWERGEEAPVRVISQKRLYAAAERHPIAIPSVERWYGLTRSARWLNFGEMSDELPCKGIGDDRYVFKIHGNHYRLVAHVRFARVTKDADGKDVRVGGSVRFKFFGSHAEYDKIDATTIEPS